MHQTITALFGLDLGIAGVAYSSDRLWLSGYPNQALERIDNAVKLAREVVHAESLAWTLLAKSLIHQRLRDGRQVRIATEELFSICEANGLIMQPALAKLIHGWALAVGGDAKNGCIEIRDAFKTFSTAGLVLMEREGHALLADAYLFERNAEQGLLSLEEPLTAVKSEERNFAAELCRLKGEFLRLSVSNDRDHIEEVESLFREAIDLARHQRAKSLELRASSSLARLLRDTNRRDEARAMLTEIYNWFTEGFDTADLKDAKALLEELSN